MRWLPQANASSTSSRRPPAFLPHSAWFVCLFVCLLHVVRFFGFWSLLCNVNVFASFSIVHRADFSIPIISFFSHSRVSATYVLSPFGSLSSCWLAAGAGAALPPHDCVPEQRVLEQGQPRGLRPVLRLRLPEGVLEQVQRRRIQVKIGTHTLESVRSFLPLILRAGCVETS